MNGWTNWDTWNVNLWLMNGYTTCKDAERMARHAEDKHELAEELEEYCRDLGIGSLDGVNYDEVNWLEMAEGLME